VIVESLLGGLFGGLLRLAPEALKFFDRKNEREHELRMLGAEMEFAKIRGEIAMRQTEAAISVSELDAIMQATKEQGQTARAAGKFVSALSALVRPVVTYWFVALYTAHKAAAMLMAMEQSGDWREVMVTSWGDQDWAIFSMLLGFWFIGRAWEREKPRAGGA
jgi:hypothetical protein